MFFVQRHERLRLFLHILLVLFLDLFYFRLDALHEHLLFRAFVEKREEDDADEKRDKNDRESQIMERDRIVKKYQEIEDWEIKNILEPVKHIF